MVHRYFRIKHIKIIIVHNYKHVFFYKFKTNVKWCDLGSMVITTAAICRSKTTIIKFVKIDSLDGSTVIFYGIVGNRPFPVRPYFAEL